jgi:hypothetical protein
VLDYETTGNSFTNNLIGTGADGQSPLPNGWNGINIQEAHDNTVGFGNTIAHNGGAGVRIGETQVVGNTVTRNSIYGNLLGQIDRYGAAPAPLPPTLTDWDGETVSGLACAGCQIEIFSNRDPQPAGHIYVDTTAADGSGDFSIVVGTGYLYLSATATDGTGTTSEFASGIKVGFDVFLPLALKESS